MLVDSNINKMFCCCFKSLIEEGQYVKNAINEQGFLENVKCKMIKSGQCKAWPLNFHQVCLWPSYWNTIPEIKEGSQRSCAKYRAKINV